MHRTLLWVGAGDIAQRCVTGLDRSVWQSTALKRNPLVASAFTQQLTADITQAHTLQHLPSASHIVYSPTPNSRTPEAYQALYETGLKNLMQAIDKNALQRFIFISSTSVYGADQVPQDEFSMLKPSSFSGQAIQAAEAYLQAELKEKLTIVRFSGLYGPGRHRIFDLLRQQQLRINPAMSNYANRIHVDDAARVCAHVLSLPTPAACYVATDSTPLPIRQLYAHLAKRLGVAEPLFDANLTFESKHFCNQRLLSSGFLFLYPQTLVGYDRVLNELLTDSHES